TRALPSFPTRRSSDLAAFTCPTDTLTGRFQVQDYYAQDLAEAATTSYVACHGDYDSLLYVGVEGGNGLFWRNSAVRLADILDGRSEEHTSELQSLAYL